MNLERTLIYQIFFLWKSAIFHPIKLPFDAEDAEKIIKSYLFYIAYVGLMNYLGRKSFLTTGDFSMSDIP